MSSLKPAQEPALLRKWREWPAWNRWLVVILAALTLPALLTPSPDPEPLTPEQVRTQQIQQHFSGWNGAHEGLEQLVKSQLLSPDSYKHIKTEYWDKSDHLIVNMTYQATNAFGADVQHFAKAKTSLDGNVLELIEAR